MEKLLLDAFLLFKELDVVYQKNVRPSVFSLEFHHLLLVDGFDVIVGKGLRRNIEDLQIVVVLQKVNAGRVEKVGLPES